MTKKIKHLHEVRGRFAVRINAPKPPRGIVFAGRPGPDLNEWLGSDRKAAERAPLKSSLDSIGRSMTPRRCSRRPAILGACSTSGLRSGAGSSRRAGKLRRPSSTCRCGGRSDRHRGGGPDADCVPPQRAPGAASRSPQIGNPPHSEEALRLSSANDPPSRRAG